MIIQGKTVRQGDIFYARISGDVRGSIQKGDRPVVIISADWLNRSSPIVRAAAITSQIKNADMPTHVVLPKLAGLPKQSMVLAEQTMELLPEDLYEYRCSLSEEVYKQVDRALRRSIRRNSHGDGHRRWRSKRSRKRKVR